MRVLVLNAGSSSLKFQLLDTVSGQVFAKGASERIGEGDEGIFSYKTAATSDRIITAIPTHSDALSLVFKMLDDAKAAGDQTTFEAIGHRIVHGGAYFTDSALVQEDTVDLIRECSTMAPLHNPPAVAVIEGCQQLLPEMPNVVCFDTSFHMTMPAEAYTYALPQDLVEEHKLRRYGFHGISHKFVARAVRQELGEDNARTIASCHIGNGASLCAIKDGKSIDTTMGFTPLDGLVMGTRCGSIDPATVTYLMEHTGMTPAEMNKVLNSKSGMLALSGRSNDMREIEDGALAGDEACDNALNVYCYVIRRHLGAMVFAMQDLDVITFEAGIGEHSSVVRERVLQGMEAFGIKLDPEKNANCHGDFEVISADDSRVKIVVVATNEEMMIALDTERLVNA